MSDKKAKKSNLSLPVMEHNFHINLRDKIAKKTYEGDFTYKRPNLGAQSEIMKMTARLNGDLNTIPESLSMFHEMCSTLKVCLIHYPEWWEQNDFGMGFHDTDIVREIYSQIEGFNEEWNKEIFGEKDE